MKRSGFLQRRTPLRRASWFEEVSKLPEDVKAKPLAYSTLKRKTRLNPKRKKPRKDGQYRDKAYLRAVMELGTCSASILHNAGPCWGATHPHHPYKIDGIKCGDDEVVDLCAKHHGCIHALIDGQASGPFRGWSRQERVSWCAEMAASTRDRVAQSIGPAGHGRRRAS